MVLKARNQRCRRADKPKKSEQEGADQGSDEDFMAGLWPCYFFAAAR
jgi:hypothetical protein